jgi:hypothetical protein
MSDIDFRNVFAHLCRVHKDRLFVIGALPLGGGATECKTFNHTAESAFIIFAQRNLDRDLCQVMNEPTKPIDGWTGRTETAFSNVWHIVIDFDLLDGIDADLSRKRVIDVLTNDRPASVPPPTWIEQANGIKAYWSLREPINIGGDKDAAEDAKLYGIGLENAFKPPLAGVCKVDSCRSIDHLFRIAGIVCRKPNQPDVPVVIVDDHINDPAFMYAADQLPKAPKDQPETPGDELPPVEIGEETTWQRYASVHEIPVSARMRHVIRTGDDDPEYTGHDKYKSRSEAQHGCTCAMVRAGMSVGQICGVLTDPKFKISEEIFYDKSGKKRHDWKSRYLPRQLDRAREKAAVDSRKEKIRAEGWISDKNGVIVANNPDNIRHALELLGLTIKHDRFADKMIAVHNGETKRVEDKHYVTWRFSVYDKFKFLPPVEAFDLVVNDTAYRNEFHPVCDYFNGLVWDGVKRIDKWLTTYGGADDTALNNAIGRIVLIAAVRRIREPGCKFDEMLTLESEQGNLKSTALRILAVKDEWFSDYLPFNARASERIEALKGRLIVEAAEITGLSKSEVENIKAFLSRSNDSGTRLAYGKCERDFPRQCIFLGTTNDQSYLSDTTGNRRFWPVRVGRFIVDTLARDRDQLWAEAAQAEASGESIRLDSSLYHKAAEQQQERRKVSAIEEKLSPIFGPGGADGVLWTDKVWEILEVVDVEKKNRMGTEVGKIMQSFGWKKTRKRKDGKPTWCYVRGDGQSQLFADDE